jgi:hypothetical protein
MPISDQYKNINRINKTASAKNWGKTTHKNPDPTTLTKRTSLLMMD